MALSRPVKAAAQKARFWENDMAENTAMDVKKLSFEHAIEELESIVKRLEDGKVPLEESVAIYERGEALKRRCEELLRQAEARVDKITTDSSGRVTGTEPLDVQ
jgi:exodeoxyribonuclease VII small subunit